MKQDGITAVAALPPAALAALFERSVASSYASKSDSDPVSVEELKEFIARNSSGTNVTRNISSASIGPDSESGEKCKDPSRSYAYGVVVDNDSGRYSIISTPTLKPVYVANYLEGKDVRMTTGTFNEESDSIPPNCDFAIGDQKQLLRTNRVGGMCAGKSADGDTITWWHCDPDGTFPSWEIGEHGVYFRVDGKKHRLFFDGDGVKWEEC